jgi:oxygen-independent coproporphyrinogen-3 oxidase
MEHIEGRNHDVSGNARASALYLHVPFCEAKCPYCAFASAEKRDGDEELYLDAVEREIGMRARGSRPIETLYIGGGTPSVLSPHSWSALLRMIDKHFTFVPGAERTVEANPGSLSGDHIKLWSDWGIGRVSIGVQSLNDERLEFLGRVHNSRQAREAVTSCLGSAFSVSLDMMFGLPGETMRDWMADLRNAVSLGTNHISIYQLSIEEGTPFAGKNLSLTDGYGQYRYAQWRLERAGYGQYEIASFAFPGYESRHNLNYWNDGEYLGVGPSAWSYVGNRRFKNAPSLGKYCLLTQSGSPEVFGERVGREKSARQAAILALRTTRGIDWTKFETRYGEQIAKTIKNELGQFPDELVMNWENSSRLTPKGFRLGNAIWSELI